MLTHSRSATFTLTVIVSALTTVLAAAAPPMHARVSHVDESALVKGPEDEEWAFATVNALILPGDTLWADKEGTLEVEFTGGTFLRMVDGSRIDIASLPPEGNFKASVGSFYVQRVSRSTGDIVFDTPVGHIWVERDSQVRFDVLSDGATTVSVRWGRATIRGAFSNPVVVEQGRRSYIDPGYAPSVPAPFDLAAEDAFDSWNRDRARLLALGTQTLPFIETSTPYEPLGMADLNTYGEWISVDYQYYWRPTLLVDYVPYRNGYWSYASASGYAWVGHHPFSYITSHYGYWSHHSRYGWLWEYNDIYAPAYVTAMRYGDYFLWTPIDRHGHPVYQGGFRFTAGDFLFSLGACSSVSAYDLLRGPARANAFGRHQLGHVDNSDVFIWNINVNVPSSSGSRRTYTTPARSFTPEQNIRGFSTARRVRGSARERAAQLESTVTRARPEISSARTVRSGATSARAENRRASVRTIRISRTASTESGATVHRATRSAANTRNLSGQTRRTRFANNDARDTRPLQQYHPSTWTTRTQSEARANTPSRARSTDAPTQSPRATSSRTTRASTATTHSTRTRASTSAPSVRTRTIESPRPSRSSTSNVTRISHRPSTRTAGTSRVRESAPSPRPAARPSTTRIGSSSATRSAASPSHRSGGTITRASRPSPASAPVARTTRVSAPAPRASRTSVASRASTTRVSSRQPSARARTSSVRRTPSTPSRSSSASIQSSRRIQPQIAKPSPRGSSARVSSPSTSRTRASSSTSSRSPSRARTRR